MSLFWIFGTYGVLIILLLTSAFWKWSGMASIGGFALILIGPLVMTAIAIINYRKRKMSIYHKIATFSSLVFIIIIAATILIANLSKGF